MCASGVISAIVSKYLVLFFAVLQKHYKVIEALALDYEEMPDVEDQISSFVNSC